MERERYSLSRAHSKLERPLEQIKDVMRYSDVRSVSISKWNKKDKDGNITPKFYTNINSTLDDSETDIYNEEE